MLIFIIFLFNQQMITTPFWMAHGSCTVAKRLTFGCSSMAWFLLLTIPYKWRFQIAKAAWRVILQLLQCRQGVSLGTTLALSIYINVWEWRVCWIPCWLLESVFKNKNILRGLIFILVGWLRHIYEYCFSVLLRLLSPRTMCIYLLLYACSEDWGMLFCLRLYLDLKCIFSVRALIF